ncbi:MAG: hypothetical protein FJ161_02105 [Gammaproteobacteria bacterium]|nr:hypothetical protein [Gammaproteobacteria bacterium]
MNDWCGCIISEILSKMLAQRRFFQRRVKHALGFLILDSGTELSAKGVLVPPKVLADRGRGDRSKTRLGKVQGAAIDEPSKKKSSKINLLMLLDGKHAPVRGVQFTIAIES